MTRINIGIQPHELCDQHLRAEHYELPRVWLYAVQMSGKPITDDVVPPLPTLGTGHVRYFINKGGWLRTRWMIIREELGMRGVVVKPAEFRTWPADLVGDHILLPPNHENIGRELLVQRLIGRMPPKPTWTNSEPPAWAFRSPNVRKMFE